MTDKIDKRKHFIIARSRKQADYTAEDWGWQPRRKSNGAFVWVNANGDEVTYAGSVHMLRGIPLGQATIYLGFGWQDNREACCIYEAGGIRQAKFVTDPTRSTPPEGME